MASNIGSSLVGVSFCNTPMLPTEMIEKGLISLDKRLTSLKSRALTAETEQFAVKAEKNFEKGMMTAFGVSFASIAIFNPIDKVTTVRQTQISKETAVISWTKELRNKPYAGALPGFVGSCLKNAVFFVSLGPYESFFKEISDGRLGKITASSASGITEAIVGGPISFLRTRAQLGTNVNISETLKTKGFVETTRMMHAGVVANCFRNGIFWPVFFASSENMRSAILPHVDTSTNTITHVPMPVVNFCIGGVSGASAALSTLLLNRAGQIQKAEAGTIQRGIITISKDLIVKEGLLQAFTKGFGLTAGRMFAAGAVTELIRRQVDAYIAEK